MITVKPLSIDYDIEEVKKLCSKSISFGNLTPISENAIIKRMTCSAAVLGAFSDSIDKRLSGFMACDIILDDFPDSKDLNSAFSLFGSESLVKVVDFVYSFRIEALYGSHLWPSIKMTKTVYCLFFKVH